MLYFTDEGAETQRINWLALRLESKAQNSYFRLLYIKSYFLFCEFILGDDGILYVVFFFLCFWPQVLRNGSIISSGLWHTRIIGPCVAYFFVFNNVIHKKLKHPYCVQSLGGKFKCIISMYAEYKNKLIHLKVFWWSSYLFFFLSWIKSYLMDGWFATLCLNPLTFTRLG